MGNPPSAPSPQLRFGKGQSPAAAPPPPAALPHLSWGASGERVGDKVRARKQRSSESKNLSIQSEVKPRKSENWPAPLILITQRKICNQFECQTCYSMLIFTYSLHYLWLLGQRAGQVLRRELSRGWGGGFAVSFPKGRRKGGVAGEEKGSGRTNNLLNQRRTCCSDTKISPNIQSSSECLSQGFFILIQKTKSRIFYMCGYMFWLNFQSHF